MFKLHRVAKSDAKLQRHTAVTMTILQKWKISLKF